MYLFLVNLVLKSMLLAIIMQAYDQAFANAGPKARTLWAQLGDVLVEVRARAQGAMRLSDVAEVLDEPEEDDDEWLLSSMGADDEHGALYLREFVSVQAILNAYYKHRMKPGTAAQEAFRRKYAREYLLRRVAEYFDFAELKEPTVQETRRKEAYQRLRELDVDFKGLEKKLQDMQGEFRRNVERFMLMVEDLDAEDDDADDDRGGDAGSAEEEGEGTSSDGEVSEELDGTGRP